uniref:Acylphosphatase-like domain-containing protein n=1 Tax=Vespula pensylvanica TaxID=30213 RepID=A0A834P3Z5_VESPE|nr:hypothetical protein H0235_007036 [Vespula pensylvanica]
MRRGASLEAQGEPQFRGFTVRCRRKLSSVAPPSAEVSHGEHHLFEPPVTVNTDFRRIYVGVSNGRLLINASSKGCSPEWRGNESIIQAVNDPMIIELRACTDFGAPQRCRQRCIRLQPARSPQEGCNTNGKRKRRNGSLGSAVPALEISARRCDTSGG